MDQAQVLHIRGLALACLSFLLVAGVAGATSLTLDLDGDGLSAGRERSVGTSALHADTDGDGLPDGWESSRGIDPREPDSDQDGLRDDVEAEFGSDPGLTDTDGDGLSDLAENPDGDGGPDCDGDGAYALRETDDDGDARPDAQEQPNHRCDVDVDDDGLVDGDEGNPDCVTLADCDRDGVQDAEERPAGFDPLDPDTFDVHLPDGVSYAFAKSGQPASRDEDTDGIPDSWESQTGLIDWGSFRPQPGQRDLLVEFVRVLGPDSGRYSDLSLTPAYDRVKAAFTAQAIQFHYIETVVQLNPEPVAAATPSRTTAHYRTVLDGARYAGNPYVLTVVLNPQHDQSKIVHAGVAPLRGMLAAVDVSQFVQFWYDSVDGNYTNVGPLSPFIESLISSGRVSMASQAGQNADGTFYAYTVSGREVRWTPYWFKGPQIRHANNQLVPLVINRRVLEDAPLAHTILHEVGHTLGLCHTHEEDCQVQLPLDERARHAESSMSYTSPEAFVGFLPGEWSRVQSYLACPPPTPIRLVAEGASMDARLDAKYAYEFDPDPENAGRSCADLQPVPRTIEPVTDAFRYDPPPERASPPPAKENPVPIAAYWAGTAGLASFAALTIGRRLRPQAPPKFP